MVQSINVLWNDNFVNLTLLPLLCTQNSWSHTYSTTGSYGRLVGYLVDKIQVNFEYLKFIIDQIFKLLLCLTKLQHYQSNVNMFKLVFLTKTYFRQLLEVQKFLKLQFSLSIPTIKYYCTLFHLICSQRMCFICACMDVTSYPD